MLSRRVVAGGGVLLAAAVVASVAVRGNGERSTTFEMVDGAAWVASSQVGLMTLIDGASGQVAARVEVADGPSELTVAQTATTGYAVDGGTGSVSRVDPTTFAVGAPVQAIDAADRGVQAWASDDALYVVDADRGRVAVADPTDLRPLEGAPSSLAAEITSTTLDGDGRLWLGTSGGDLLWFDGADRHDRADAVTDPRDADLLPVDGGVALLDRGAQTVTLLDDQGRPRDEVCVDTDPTDASVRFAGSPRRRRVYVVSGDDGVLRVSDLDASDCRAVAVPVADAGDNLGVPEEVGGRVLVPDYTTGTVAVVDLGDGSVHRTGELVPAGTPFQLFDRDGIAFYNDPQSERAGVVHLDGSFTAVAKYDPADPSAGIDEPAADESPGQRPPTGPEPTTPSPPEDGPGPTPPADDQPVAPSDTRPPRPDEDPGAEPTPGPGATTSTTGTGPSGTGPTTSSTSTTSSTTTSTTTTSTTTPPPDTTPPTFGFRVHDWTGTAGDCRPGQEVACTLTVDGRAEDLESGVTNTTVYVIVSWKCSTPGFSIWQYEGTPLLGGPYAIGSANGDIVVASRRYGCDGPHRPGGFVPPAGSLMAGASIEYFVRATNGAGLTAESPHTTFTWGETS